MNSRTFLFILLALAMQSCQQTSLTTSFWVSGIKTECDSEDVEVLCLQVYNGMDIENASWENLKAPIEGFEFEAGFLQHIQVKEKKIEDAPSEGPSVSYTFLKVLDKQRDTRYGLNDIWVCKMIAENPIDTASPAPTLEINLRKMMIMGSNGCNNFNGEIKSLDAFKIKIGPTAETRKMCADMSIPDAFTVAINNVATYKIEELTLRFYDSLGNELLAFLKVD